jgi:hypothetical protein
VTRSATEVRLRSRSSDDPAGASSTVTARPGELELDTCAGRRTLRIGSDVVTARYDQGVGLAGRLALVAPDGSTAAVLDVADWVPDIVAASGHCRGGLDDPRAWTGLRQLLGTAGLDLDDGKVAEDPDVRPTRRRPGPATVVSMALGVAGALWFSAVLLSMWLDSLGAALGVLVIMTLCSAVLAADHALRSRRSRRLPAGEVVRPQPAVPVTRRFARDAALVLSPGQGTVELVVVRHSSLDQEWFDGPAAPLGIHCARVITPAGFTAPERVDLVDGLGRQVARLPWDQWFGRTSTGLDRLAACGLPIEHVTGPSLGAARGLLGPSSMRHAVNPFVAPGGLGYGQDLAIAFAVTAVPITVGAQLPSTPTLVLGIVNGVLLISPLLTRLLARPILDRPQAVR